MFFFFLGCPNPTRNPNPPHDTTSFDPHPDTPPGSVARDRDRVFDDVRHDPYQIKGKYREPTVCASCRCGLSITGAGRWGEAPAQAHKATCPACARTRDAICRRGSVTLSGAFFHAHRAEWCSLLKTRPNASAPSHPLNRIMNVAEGAPDATVITTCDVHSPRRIGEALKRAYDGHFGCTSERTSTRYASPGGASMQDTAADHGSAHGAFAGARRAHPRECSQAR